MSEERLNLVEREIHAHKAEMRTIANTMEKLVEQGEKTHELINQALLRDERFEGKLQRLEGQILSKINHQQEALTRAHGRIDRIDSVGLKIALFVLFTVMASVLSLVMI